MTVVSYHRNESSSVADIVLDLAKLIVKVQRKIHQQMIWCSEILGNLVRTSNSEKVSFQMLTERNYAI